MEREWEKEPNEWHGIEHGFDVYAKRHPSAGHWCGYVSLPSEHPLHGKGYDDVDVEVHGGLTYAEKGIDGVWDFRFDCAHSGDFCPSRSELAFPLFAMNGYETYRNLEYVQRQIKSLAEQLFNLGAK